MKVKLYYYNDSNLLLANNSELNNDFTELVKEVESISENEILDFKKGKFSKGLSISGVLNYILQYKFEGLFYSVNVPINERNNSKTKWSILFSNQALLVNVCFKHNLNTSHELLKLELGIQEKVNNKLINANIGILITVSDKLKKIGGFDNSICTAEQIENEIGYYKKVFKSPLIVIALDEVNTFQINVVKESGGKKAYVDEY